MFKRTKRSYNLKKKGSRFVKRNRYGKYTKRVASRNKIHYFKRRSLAAVLTGTPVTGADFFGAVTYSLGNVANYGEFVSLYDRYKIKAVRTDFVWLRRNDHASSYSSTFPTVYSLIDYNDDAVPTSTNQMLEYGKCRTKVFNDNRNIVSVYFRPKMACTVTDWQGGATTGVNLPEYWISSSTSPKHFGLKYGVSGLWTQDIIEVYHTYYLAFKDSK